MKIWAVKTRQNLAFFSADVKCKVSIGEPDCPIALVTCGKRIIVGSNETFMIGDHDFIKLSLTPVAYLLHELPKLDDSEESPKVGEWYTGQVYYRLKKHGYRRLLWNSLCCRAFWGHNSTVWKTPCSSLCIYRWGPEHKVDNLSVQKSYISLF